LSSLNYDSKWAAPVGFGFHNVRGLQKIYALIRRNISQPDANGPDNGVMVHMKGKENLYGQLTEQKTRGEEQTERGSYLRLHLTNK
jgi:hypothetical protein